MICGSMGTQPFYVKKYGRKELPNVSNVQVNVCKLNDGVSLEEYNEVTEDYVKWSKKNDVETFYVRHFPLFSHSTTVNPLEIMKSRKF